MAELTIIIFIAFLLDIFIGDPLYRYHPIRIIGRCINLLEEGLRGLGWVGKGGGIILVLTTMIVILSTYLILSTLFFHLSRWLGLFFNLYLCYSCLALGDLLNHIRPVIRFLESGDLNQARKSIAKVVGREVQVLDEYAVGRAAVETMAENFVDGFLSPLFWCLAGGILSIFLGTPTVNTSISLMFVSKVSSTLDSMVGYKNRKYIKFGWAGARVDDLMNFFPARLSLFPLFSGAVMARLQPLKGIKIAFRDRLKHDSPNAAHAESFVAGALDIRLGGTIPYPEGLKNKPWLGDGTPQVDTQHIEQTVNLLRHSAWVAVIALFSSFFVTF